MLKLGLFDPQEVVEAVRSVLPERRPIGHHEPVINGRELAAVSSAIDVGLTSEEHVNRFEASIAAATGAEQVVATSSGTAALHLALLAVGVQPGDEVLVPALTFVATANAVAYVGAVPNFIDGALTVNAYKVRRYLERETEAGPRGRTNKRTGRPVTAVIPVHLLGSPADVEGLCRVADDFGLVVVEDAAQALGSTSGNRACGTVGRAGMLSFNYNKIVTTCGGGALLTDDPWVAAQAHKFATVGRVRHPWLIEHDAVGWNYRMGTVNAVLGLAQMEQLDVVLAQKSDLAGKYRGALSGCRSAEFLDTSVSWGGRSNNWLSAVSVSPRCGGVPQENRDRLLEALHADGLLARALPTPLHMLPMYRDCPHDDLRGAELAVARTVCLPSGAGL